MTISIFVYMDVLPACMSVHRVRVVPTEEGIRPLGLELQADESHHVGAGTTIAGPGPMKEQSVLLTAEPSL